MANKAYPILIWGILKKSGRDVHAVAALVLPNKAFIEYFVHLYTLLFTHYKKIS